MYLKPELRVNAPQLLKGMSSIYEDIFHKMFSHYRISQQCKVLGPIDPYHFAKQDCIKSLGKAYLLNDAMTRAREKYE